MIFHYSLPPYRLKIICHLKSTMFDGGMYWQEIHMFTFKPQYKTSIESSMMSCTKINRFIKFYKKEGKANVFFRKSKSLLHDFHHLWDIYQG